MKLINNGRRLLALAGLLISLQVIISSGCASQEEKDYQEKRETQKTALVHVALPTWTINFKLTHVETGQELFQYAVLKAKDEAAARKLLTEALGTSADVRFEIMDVQRGKEVNTNTR